MTHPSKITNHAALAVGNLLSQFAGSTRLHELIECFAAEIQDLEDLFHELYDECTLDAALGAQLDLEGKLIGWPRGDLSDDEYRAMLKVALVAYHTDTSPAEAAYIVSKIVNKPVRYIVIHPAHFSLEFTTTASIDQQTIDLINAIMPYVAPAGVSWQIVEGVSVVAGDPVFLLDTADQGLDDGQLSRRIDVL